MDSDSLSLLKSASNGTVIDPFILFEGFPKRDPMYAVALVRYLQMEGYLEETMTGEAITGYSTGKYRITPRGKDFLESLDKQILNNKRENKKNLFGEIRAWITLIIALLGFVLSLLKWIYP